MAFNFVGSGTFRTDSGVSSIYIQQHTFLWLHQSDDIRLVCADAALQHAEMGSFAVILCDGFMY